MPFQNQKKRGSGNVKLGKAVCNTEKKKGGWFWGQRKRAGRGARTGNRKKQKNGPTQVKNPNRQE